MIDVAKPADYISKIHRVYKVQHGRDWELGQGYKNLKSTVAFPFNIMSSSAKGGYIGQIHTRVTGNIDIDSNGEVELDGNGGILLNTAPSGTEGNGIIIKLHSTTTTAGNLYYKSNFAAAWSQADADSDGATRMLAVALGTSSSTDGMLLQGIFRKASHGFSAGAPLYVSTTAGAFTTTAPSGSGDYVRVVGYVIDSNTIYFNPGTTWVEVS